MKSWKKPTPDIVDRALASAKKETDRQFFFTRLMNPLWLSEISTRGYFQSPPGALHLADGSTEYPFWPELAYLRNIASEIPVDVVEVILGIPWVDNPGVDFGILNTVLALPGQQSVRLQQRVVESARSFPRVLHHSISEVLAYWVEQNEVAAALEVLAVLVRFSPDPASDEKRRRYRENSRDISTLLRPSPTFDDHGYQTLLGDQVRKLSDQEPYLVARLLLDATAQMIELSTHFDSETVEDRSEVWCPRLREGRGTPGYVKPEVTLAQTLTHACERVFGLATERVPELDQELRKQRWKLFERLRLHLYALYPNEQTKDWVREAIINHEDYGKWTHHYEFQQMVQSACDTFGGELLGPEECGKIFDAILAGPPKERYESRIDEEEDGEEWFVSLSESFHRRQLNPFKSVLFSEYLQYFERLEGESEEALKDEDYLQVGPVTGGSVRQKSPKSVEELSQMSDEELLAFINEWDEEQPWYARTPVKGTPGSESWLEEVNVYALAEAFQSAARDVVVTDDLRLSFWVENRDRIEKPIFVKALVGAMREAVIGKNYCCLGEFLEFCQWVLSRPGHEPESGRWDSDQDKDAPGWRSSRRAVVDLVGSCLGEDVDVPVGFQEGLSAVLRMVCSQADQGLDSEDAAIPDYQDYLTVAINNTRSIALEHVVEFGFWLRRFSQEADIAEVSDIFEGRFGLAPNVPLTLPERAVLGFNYPRILGLDNKWGALHRLDFFPQKELSHWTVAFGTCLHYTNPNLPTFSALRDDYEFALKNLPTVSALPQCSADFAESLGKHLFSFYVWSEYPLTGGDSLLEQFYEAVGSNLVQRGFLFDHVGRSLMNTPKPLAQDLLERILAFFEWRLREAQPEELQDFSMWLDAECLNEDWRLDSYSRILDRGLPAGRGSMAR